MEGILTPANVLMRGDSVSEFYRILGMDDMYVLFWIGEGVTKMVTYICMVDFYLFPVGGFFQGGTN